MSKEQHTATAKTSYVALATAKNVYIFVCHVEVILHNFVTYIFATAHTRNNSKIHKLIMLNYT